MSIRTGLAGGSYRLLYWYRGLRQRVLSTPVSATENWGLGCPGGSASCASPLGSVTSPRLLQVTDIQLSKGARGLSRPLAPLSPLLFLHRIADEGRTLDGSVQTKPGLVEGVDIELAVAVRGPSQSIGLSVIRFATVMGH